MPYTPHTMGSSGEHIHPISREQGRKEKTLPDAATRVWKTTRYPEEVRKALEKDVPKKVLVIGCGVDESAFYADILPQAHVVGVDFNPKVIQAAQDQFPRENVTYLTGDILDNEFAQRFEPESFGAIVLTGVLTNLIHQQDISTLFERIDLLLAPQGRVIVSDYLLNQSTGEGWDYRYRRDLLALIDAGIVTEKDPIPPYGTIVTRPYGLSTIDALQLSSEEVAKAIQENRYERLARHWHPFLLMRFITQATQGHLRMKGAEVDMVHYDPEIEIGTLGWLTSVFMAMEKKAESTPRDLLRETGALQAATAIALMEGESYEAFFDQLVE